MTQVAIVAGSHRETGAAAALRFAERGLDVALIAGNLAMADRTARQVTDIGRRCIAVEADLADTESFTAALGQVQSLLGNPSVLLNCVALGAGPKQAESCSYEARFTMTRRSLRALFVCCRAVAGPMARHRWGRIINVAQSVRTGDDEWRAAQPVLVGLIGFTASVARELAPFGITANYLAPVACAPLGRPPAHQAAMPTVGAESYSTGVAHLTEFLISDQAATVTGQGSYLAGRPATPEL